MSKEFDSSKHAIMVYIIKNHAYIYEKLGVTIGFDILSSINSFDEMLGCEWLHLSYFHSIKDGALRFCYVMREE